MRWQYVRYLGNRRMNNNHSNSTGLVLPPSKWCWNRNLTAATDTSNEIPLELSTHWRAKYFDKILSCILYLQDSLLHITVSTVPQTTTNPSVPQQKTSVKFGSCKWDGPAANHRQTNTHTSHFIYSRCWRWLTVGCGWSTSLRRDTGLQQLFRVSWSDLTVQVVGHISRRTVYSWHDRLRTTSTDNSSTLCIHYLVIGDFTRFVTATTDEQLTRVDWIGLSSAPGNTV